MSEPEIQHVEGVVQKFLEHLRIPCQVAVSKDEHDERAPLLVTINTEEDANLLIGKNGQNLQALEHVLRAVRARQGARILAVQVDVNDYRKERTQALTALAREVAERVRATKASEAMEPMSPADRRLVHTELATYQDLATESTGAEPRRRVVVRPL